MRGRHVCWDVGGGREEVARGKRVGIEVLRRISRQIVGSLVHSGMDFHALRRCECQSTVCGLVAPLEVSITFSLTVYPAEMLG